MSRQELWGLVVVIGMAAIVATVLVLETRGKEACRARCHPLSAVQVQGVCHCATESGWDRAEPPAP